MRRAAPEKAARTRGKTRAGTWVALAVVVAIVASGCGGNDGDGAAGGQAAPTSRDPGATSTTSPPPRAAARWEHLSTFSGAGNEPRLAIGLSPDVIQWRARWTCEAGSLRIDTTPAPRKPGALVNGQCPGKGEAFSTAEGNIELKVEASAPWKVEVDQQIDTPLAEPPLAEMSTAPVLVQGTFHDLEKTGSGSARLYQLPEGRRVLRLDDFSVSQNTDLFVWLSEAVEPKTSAEAAAAPKVILAELRSTLGSQNYEIPADIPTERIRSVVIWCVPVAVAYSAAPLSPP